MPEFVSKDVCEERKDRFEQMFDEIKTSLGRLETKIDKGSNGKILWKIVGIMLGFTTIIIGIVSLIAVKL